jgi:hypothetical protein
MIAHVRERTATTAALILATASALAAGDDAPDDILRRYADDYRSDPMLVDADFGVQVGGAWWRVTSRKGVDGKPNEVVLETGQPGKPTWYFTIDSADSLRQLDRGEVTFGTLAGKARMSDKVAMDAAFMPGYTPDARTPGGAFYETFTKVGFHFWYRGSPEIVPFGSQRMREIHGADSTALYYQPGLRTIWFSLKNGQHANRGGGGVGPWKKLLVFVNGAGKALIGDQTVDVKAGDRLFVPPRATNEVWNDSATPLEGVLIIFGEGA